MIISMIFNLATLGPALMAFTASASAQTTAQQTVTLHYINVNCLGKGKTYSRVDLEGPFPGCSHKCIDLTGPNLRGIPLSISNNLTDNTPNFDLVHTCYFWLNKRCEGSFEESHQLTPNSTQCIALTLAGSSGSFMCNTCPHGK